MKKNVYCKLQVEGFHDWGDAPEKYAYLRARHRHIFGIQVTVEVTDSNREVEFIELKQQIRRLLLTFFGNGSEPLEFGSMSCEHIAEWLLNQCAEAHSVSVSEDGENGATVINEGT